MTAQTFTTCPDCGEIAEIHDRFVLPSTDGPVEHMKLMCVRRHHFVLPLDSLDRVAALSAPVMGAHAHRQPSRPTSLVLTKVITDSRAIPRA